MKDDHDLDVKPWAVSEVMRRDGLRYKKIRKVPLQGNGDRQLILRQQYSLKYLQLPPDKRVIIIDETWLGSHEMRVFKYGLKGLPNSVPAYSQVLRTTLITACDSLGNVYISAAQTNSCSSVF